MRRKNVSTMRLLPLAAGALSFLCLTACKGRTADNVEPTGDTVEVVISPWALLDTLPSTDIAVMNAEQI